MVQMAKKHKKSTISEDDISTILQKYTATTVLQLLQEVSQVADVKIDWKALVKKTATGISNAREYQMLWRHLAYSDSLLEGLDDEAEPLSDDSDLEHEIEAFPSVSSEISLEAEACVKVLMASGTPRDANLHNSSTVDAPSNTNNPNGPSSRDNSKLVGFMKGTNSTVPVSVKKQPVPIVTSAEGLDADGLVSGSLPPRRKRKPWSEEEDLMLMNAVKKMGEGNWANILKEDFKGDRTASQLSQRWAALKRRTGNSKGNVNAGGSSKPSEAQVAANRAITLAVNTKPKVDNLKTAGSNGGLIVGTKANATPESVLPSRSEAVLLGGKNTETQPQNGPVRAIGTPGSASKFRVTMDNNNKTATPSTISIDAMVKATAVAAGARIATPSAAASLLKAAHAKKAVHIMPGGGGGPLIKSSSSVIGNANHPLHLNSVHRKVQHIMTQQVQPRPVNPVVPTVQLDVTANNNAGVLSEPNNAVSEVGGKCLARENQATTISGNASKDQVMEEQNVPMKQEDRMTE